MDYSPPQEILEKYARVLVNFALNSGKGVKKGSGDITIPSYQEHILPQ